MKYLPLFILFLAACSEPSEDLNKKQNRVPKKTAKAIVAQIDSTAAIHSDEQQEEKVPVFKDMSLDDYFASIFPDQTHPKDFETKSWEEAHRKKILYRNEYAPKNGYLSAITVNTPIEMEGDSEIEYQYTITYWKLKNGNRLVGATKSLISWVHEETMTFELYEHNANGLTKIKELADFNWTLNDFTLVNVKPIVHERLFSNPPVYVFLPNKGSEITVVSGVHEYMEDQNSYKKLMDAGVKFENLHFNPVTNLNLN